MIGFRKTFSRIAAHTTLTALLAAGYAGAQTPLERIKAMPRATDNDIAQMLTTRNDQEVSRTLALSYRDVITVFAERSGPTPDKSSEFRFLEPRENSLPKVTRKTYPQYGNPVGVFQPTNLIELGDEEFSDTPSGRFYITSFVSRATDGYERELDRLRRVAVADGISAEDYIRRFRIDSPLSADGQFPGAQAAAIRTYLPIGAVQEGMLVDLRPVDGRAVARIAFTFQPSGKEPLKCQGILPYDLSEGHRVFRSKDAVLKCEFEGTSRWVLTPWIEERIANAKLAATQRNIQHAGFCAADCRAFGGWDDPNGQFPTSTGDPFGGSSAGSNWP